MHFSSNVVALIFVLYIKFFIKRNKPTISLNTVETEKGIDLLHPHPKAGRRPSSFSRSKEIRQTYTPLQSLCLILPLEIQN